MFQIKLPYLINLNDILVIRSIHLNFCVTVTLLKHYSKHFIVTYTKKFPPKNPRRPSQSICINTVFDVLVESMSNKTSINVYYWHQSLIGLTYLCSVVLQHEITKTIQMKVFQTAVENILVCRSVKEEQFQKILSANVGCLSVDCPSTLKSLNVFHHFLVRCYQNVTSWLLNNLISWKRADHLISYPLCQDSQPWAF